MQRFSVAHPAAHLTVVDRFELGPRLVLFEAEVSSEEPQDWSEELRRLPHVRDVELIAATERSGRYRVLFAGPTFLPISKQLKLPLQTPFPVRDGVATWTVVGREDRVRALLEALRSSGVPAEIEAVRPGPLRGLTATLTERQREILRRAVLDGYFEVPRRISLTELARRVGVATSTLSVTIAVIEKKLVESHAELVELAADRGAR